MRQKMINEVLNSDRDINLKVVDIQKKALKHFNDVLHLQFPDSAVDKVARISCIQPVSEFEKCI